MFEKIISTFFNVSNKKEEKRREITNVLEKKERRYSVKFMEKKMPNFYNLPKEIQSACCTRLQDISQNYFSK